VAQDEKGNEKMNRRGGVGNKLNHVPCISSKYNFTHFGWFLHYRAMSFGLPPNQE
jgi:hypothetical protein